MDPDAAYDRSCQLMADYSEVERKGTNDEVIFYEQSIIASELVDTVRGLFDWIDKGGPMPKVWQRG